MSLCTGFRRCFRAASQRLTDDPFMNVLGGESPLDDNGVSTQKEHGQSRGAAGLRQPGSGPEATL